MENDGVIRWGIVGPGTIAKKFASDMKYVAGSELLAVGSRAQEKAEQFAREYGIPRSYGSYEELANDTDIDAIYVATPHPFHKDCVMTGLRAGKAVLCEKPFTLNADEAEEIAKAARDAQVFLMEAMWTRFLPAIVKVREWLGAGRIGEVRLLKAEYGFRAALNPRSRLFDLRLGGGALLDAGVYPISLASMIFGQAPERTVGSAHVGETGVDEHFSIIFSYPGGRSAVLNGAIRLRLQNDACIIGTEGMIHIPGFINAKAATLRANGVQETFVYEGLEHGFAFEIAEVNRCLRRGLTESSVMLIGESIQIMKTIDNIRKEWGIIYPSE